MKTRFQRIRRLPEFTRDLKRLKKRYRTIENDLETLINTLLFAFHKLQIDVDGVKRIDNIGPIRLPVYKVKKFACRSIKGRGVRTGLRLIYTYNVDDDCIELIEIYSKSDKKVEDRDRIEKYYSTS